jgi:hypothetical protein
MTSLQVFNYCSFAVLLAFLKEQQKNSKRNVKEMTLKYDRSVVVFATCSIWYCMGAGISLNLVFFRIFACCKI